MGAKTKENCFTTELKKEKMRRDALKNAVEPLT
jgi:hypothetical protein